MAEGLEFYALTLIFFSMQVAAYLLGIWLRRRAVRKKNVPSAEVDGMDYVLTSVFGLLALLVGFTFSVALGRYDARIGDLIEETNAIGTAYFRAELAEPGDRDRLKALYQVYAKTRLEYGLASLSERPEAEVRSQALRTQISEAGIAAVKHIASSPAGPLLAQSINSVLDMGVEREAVMNARIPLIIVFVLLGTSLAAAFTLGFAKAHLPFGVTWTNLLIFGLLCTAITVVLDLDRPAAGGIFIDQKPMADLVQEMSAQPSPAPRE